MLYKDVIVLAAGPSVKQYNLRGLEDCGHVIAVNGASIYQKCDVAFSMDRLVTEYCYPIWRVQGTPEIWVRRGVAKNVVLAKNVVQFEHDGNREGTKMTFEKFKLNGSNSGACAFNLAIQRAFRRVFLLGFDMIRFNKDCDPYWYPAFSWNTAGGTKDGNLKAWGEEFVEIAKQVPPGIQVFNVNHPDTTRINAFPIINFDTFREMTQ